MNKIVELLNVNKSYNTKYGCVEVLKGIDLEINQGDFLVIMGKSGCGKTTLMNIIGLMDNFTSGNYIFNERDVSKLSNNDKAKIRNGKIGFIFQSYNLIYTMSALENVELPLGYMGIGKSDRTNRALEALEKVGLSHRIRHKPGDMSGGEQQRVAIARALINNPLLILADEPTGNLDETNAKEIMKLLKNLNDNGSTITMVTHNADICDHAARMIDLSLSSFI